MSKLRQPNGNLLLLGSLRGKPKARALGFLFTMSLELILRERINSECDKLIARYHAYHNKLHAEWKRNNSRVSNFPPKQINTPEHWKADRNFNPFHVRSNSSAIARSIAKKIISKTYAPHKPFSKVIPKSGGGSRELTIFQIPDAAVSRYCYERLMTKNRHRFSSFAYAYRNDRNVHFAIQDITIDLAHDARTFIAEFDFSDFFGSIQHDYLFNQLSQNGFFVSAEEEGIIKAFLNTRDRGIPQGTSISLFLANMVCWKLDRSLEKLGLKFGRYADDTIIWSPDYAAICQSFSMIDWFSRDTGVPINAKKSAGISLLSQPGLRTEIAAKESFDFLGYSIGVGKTSIRHKAELKIKKQISYLLYKNLIQPLKTTPLTAMIIPANDRDPALLSAMMQIRRYLYGGLSRRDLADYAKGRRRHLSFKGVMSFYPLVSDEAQLNHLNGWVISAVYRAIQARSQLLRSHLYDRRHSFPFNVRRDELLYQMGRRKVGGKRLFELPNLMLVCKALKRGLRDDGIERVMHPDSSKYAYKGT